MIGASYTTRGSAGDVLNVGNLPMPEAGSGVVLVRVYTSGANPSDVKTRAGNLGSLTVPQTIPQSDSAGAVGSMAIQMAKASGAKVITTVSCDEKGAVAKEDSADTLINYKTENLGEAILLATGGKNLDHIVDVDFAAHINLTTEILKSGGTIAAYASMSNPEPALTYYPLMFNNTNMRLAFVYGMAQADKDEAAQAITAFLEKGALKGRVAATYPLEEIVAAHEYVESATQLGNVIVTMAD